MTNNIQNTDIVNASCKSTDVIPNEKEQNTIELLEAKIADLQLRITELEDDKDTIFNLWMMSFDDKQYSTMIKNEKEYKTWFRYLLSATSRFLVVMAVRDTPGSNMPKNVYKNILDAGFTNFRTDLWNTYIGVIFKGKCWCNERRLNEEKSQYYYESMDGKFSIRVSSEPYRNGDKAEIYINGKQMAQNRRGVNIVIYDTANNIMIDSICFDSHDKDNFVLSK